MKKSNQSGQSILEYSAIAVLVMVGIIAAGPNVVRSVNSYFKTAQEQAQDSFREDLTQANLVGTEVTYDLGDCTCNFTGPLCGNGTNCQRNQWAYELMCNPSTCKEEYIKYNPEFKCDSEGAPAVSFLAQFPTCTPATNYSGCPVGASSDTPSALFQNAGYRCCLDAEVAQPQQCGTADNGHEGQLLKQMRCGTGLNAQYFWEEDMSYCANSCGQKDTNAEWCNSATFNYDVSSEGDIFHVADGGCATAAAGCSGTNCPFDAWTCMAECRGDIANFGLLNDGSGCGCESGYVFDLNSNKCLVKRTMKARADNDCFVYDSWNAGGCTGTLLGTCGADSYGGSPISTFDFLVDPSASEAYVCVKIQEFGSGPTGVTIFDDESNRCFSYESGGPFALENSMYWSWNLDGFANPGCWWQANPWVASGVYDGYIFKLDLTGLFP